MMNLIIKFPQVQALVQREVRNGYYTTGPYFMAEFATQGFFASLSAFLLGTPCYFLVGRARARAKVPTLNSIF